MTERSFNARIEGTLRKAADVPRLVLGIPLSAIYCGLHASAWDSYFPTTVERQMWRAAVVIAAVGTLVVCIFFLDNTPIARAIVGRGVGLRPRNIFRWLARSCVETWLATVFLLCVFSRIFLVIEAFASVRSLPADVYETVQWSSFMPHVS